MKEDVRNKWFPPRISTNGLSIRDMVGYAGFTRLPAAGFQQPLTGTMRTAMTKHVRARRIWEVVPGVFRILVPLPIPDVRSMNAYVIVGEERNLVIDPGMAHPAGCEVMEKAIIDLGLDLNRTDFFATHHHLDHFGSVSRFLRASSRLYISRPEADFIRRIASGEVENEMGTFLEMLGFPEKDPSFFVAQFYEDGYKPRHPWPFDYIVDGDVMEQGGRRFECLVTSGHTIGHTCLYEASQGLLISGDQITAGIQFLLDRQNPLEDHLQSLTRLREMDVTLVLPGHGSPYREHRERIDILQAHHEGRADAACAALGKMGKDAYEVTVALDGRLPDRPLLATLPLVMRFIHTRHTYAYLQYLTLQGRARKEERRGRILFYPRDDDGRLPGSEPGLEQGGSQLT